MTAQLTLFEESETEKLRAELRETKKELTNVRKGLFGRFDKLNLEFMELQESMEALKSNMGMKHDTDERKILDFTLQNG